MSTIRRLFGPLLLVAMLSACAPAAAPAPKVVPTVAAGGAAAAPPPAASPAATTPAEMIDRVVAALQRLDSAEQLAFTLTTTRKVGQQGVVGGNLRWNQTRTAEIAGDGVRLLASGRPAARYKRTVHVTTAEPGKPPQSAYTLDGEVRLVDGVTYVSATYSQPHPLEPAVPGGWVRVYPSSAAVWPGLSRLELGDLDARLGRDSAALLAGQAADALRSILKNSLARAAREQGSLPGETRTGEIISLQLKPIALRVSLTDLDFADPVANAVLETVRGTPITYRFMLDTAGDLVGWDRSVDVTYDQVPVSKVGGMPEGSRLSGTYRESLALRVVPPGAPAAAITAPDLGSPPAYAAAAPAGSPRPPFADLAALDAALGGAVANGAVDDAWAQVQGAGQMPLVFGQNTAVFLQRGGKEAVQWLGDWGVTPGRRLGKTDVWMAVLGFPADSRLEYQVQVDGKQPALDPLNSRTETGGLGSKSFFAMPGYAAPDFVGPRAGVAAGSLTDNLTISSRQLGYDVNYRVYTPAGYDGRTRLPSLYVTDGQDYLAFGHMATALDNLGAAGKVRPVIAVFVDPRDTKTGENRRNAEFFDNPKYGAFLVDELVPAVERSYAADPSPDARAIVGASNGGYHAAYFALRHADQFHLIGIQSPNIAYNLSLLDDYRRADRLPVKVFMNVGSIGDNWFETRQLRDILEAKGYALRYIETNEGHSYATWRARFADLLEYFFGR